MDKTVETSAFDKYREHYRLRGGNLKQVQINQAKYLFDTKFENDPSFYAVTINGVEGIGARITMNDSYTTKHGSMRIQTKETDPIKVGDLVYHDNEYLLITVANHIHGIHYQGTLRKCNATLRWLADGVIKEAPAYFDDAFVTSDDDMWIHSQQEKPTVQLPINEDTVQICENMRFIIDIKRPIPNTYKVIGCNFFAGVGLLYLERDLFNPSVDNVELMVANYYDSKVIIPPEPPQSDDDMIQLIPKVSIEVDDNYARIGRTKKIGFKFVDAEDATPVWFVESLSNIPYQETPEGLEIYVPYDTSLIGQSIGVAVTNTFGQCEDSIILKIRGVV